MTDLIEVTGHIPYLIANLHEKGVEKVKADFLTEVIRHGYNPATPVTIRRAKFFPGAIDLAADEHGYRYYLSVEVHQK